MTTPDRPPFVVTSLDDIEELPAVGLRWKPVRRTLDVRAFGINAYAADAGQDVVEAHDETSWDGSPGGPEELYLVVRGRARFTLDGSEHDAPAGTLVFARDPRVRRAATAEEDGTLVVAIGADPTELYQPSGWEHWFIAEGHSKAGDHQAAVEIMAAAGDDHTGNPSYHYNFACYLARAGRLDEAAAQLRRAHEAAPERIGEWAQRDRDLDALRERPDWPL